MQIKEYILKLTRPTANLPKPIEISHDYRLGADISIIECSDVDNQDGTFNKVYKGKLLTAEILNDQGKIMKLKVKGSQADKWRKQLYMIWQEHYVTEYEEEEFYQTVMNLLRSDGENIVANLLKK